MWRDDVVPSAMEPLALETGLLRVVRRHVPTTFAWWRIPASKAEDSFQLRVIRDGSNFDASEPFLESASNCVRNRRIRLNPPNQEGAATPRRAKGLPPGAWGRTASTARRCDRGSEPYGKPSQSAGFLGGEPSPRLPEPQRRQTNPTAHTELSKDVGDVLVRRCLREAQTIRDLLLGHVREQESNHAAIGRRQMCPRCQQPVAQYHVVVEPFQGAQRVGGQCLVPFVERPRRRLAVEPVVSLRVLV